MATTTTNNGWTIPQSTDYVKDGATAIATLGNNIDTSTGKGLIAWQTYAPTLSNGWANGNGTWTARYCQIGKTVHFMGAFTIGSTTTKGTNMDISLPVTARSGNYLNNAVNMATANNAVFTAIIASTLDKMTVYALNAAGTYLGRNAITATVPFTWATGDTFTIAGTYEAA